MGIYNFRPEDYEYPIGLSLGVIGAAETSNSATNTTGGTKTVDTTNNFAVHTYTTSGTFDPGFDGTVEYLVVAGGGAGASMGGGGGAGGVRTGFIEVQSTETYNVTVGGGASSSPVQNDTNGANGTNSSFATITSTGGGGGGARSEGHHGGSGGGSGGFPYPTPWGVGDGNIGNYKPPEGNPGGDGRSDNTYYTINGGGGGAGGPGKEAYTYRAGDGGVGMNSSITGVSTAYAGGGGGGGSGQPVGGGLRPGSLGG